MRLQQPCDDTSGPLEKAAKAAPENLVLARSPDRAKAESSDGLKRKVFLDGLLRRRFGDVAKHADQGGGQAEERAEQGAVHEAIALGEVSANERAGHAAAEDAEERPGAGANHAV